jgi:hypothetical protein
MLVMMRLILLVVNLFALLPWWAALGVIAAMVVGLMLLGKYLVYRLFRDCVAAVANQGAALKNAAATVHSVTPTEAPQEASPFDLDPEDENYDEDLDGNWQNEEADFYWIEVTIAPAQDDVDWNPSALSLVAADFEPSEELEACAEMCALHSLEKLRDGKFRKFGEGMVTGEQRLRLLIAAPPGLRDVKFAYFFEYFGELVLPGRLVSAR